MPSSPVYARPYYAPGPRTLTTSFVLHCECVVRQSCSCPLCMMPVTVCMFRSLMPDIISSRSSLRGLSASAQVSAMARPHWQVLALAHPFLHHRLGRVLYTSFGLFGSVGELSSTTT